MIEEVFTVVGAVTIIVALSAAVGYWISANRSRRANRTVTGVWHKIGGEWVELKREADDA